MQLAIFCVFFTVVNLYNRHVRGLLLFPLNPGIVVLCVTEQKQVGLPGGEGFGLL